MGASNLTWPRGSSSPFFDRAGALRPPRPLGTPPPRDRAPERARMPHYHSPPTAPRALRLSLVGRLLEVVKIDGRRRRMLPGHHLNRPQLLRGAEGVSPTHNHPYPPYPPKPPATAPERLAPSPRPAPCAPAFGSPCMLVGAVVSFSTRMAGMLFVASCSVRAVASERVRRVCSVWLVSALFGVRARRFVCTLLSHTCEWSHVLGWNSYLYHIPYIIPNTRDCGG